MNTIVAKHDARFTADLNDGTVLGRGLSRIEVWPLMSSHRLIHCRIIELLGLGHLSLNLSHVLIDLLSKRLFEVVADVNVFGTKLLRHEACGIVLVDEDVFALSVTDLDSDGEQFLASVQRFRTGHVRVMLDAQLVEGPSTMCR